MQVPSPSVLPLQKDPGFDRGQFHKQIAVMRGQVSLDILLVSSLRSLWEGYVLTLSKCVKLVLFCSLFRKGSPPQSPTSSMMNSVLGEELTVCLVLCQLLDSSLVNLFSGLVLRLLKAGYLPWWL